MFRKLLLVCLSLMLVSGAFSAAEEMPSSAPFFAATLDDLKDKPMAMESVRGKPILVNFWARWCGPCREEIPELVDVHAKHKANGLTMVGVAVEENTASVQEFAAAYKMDYLVLMGKDKSLDLMRALGNNRGFLPFTIAIDSSGKVVAKKMGVLTTDDLDGMLKSTGATR